ncbi:MAG: N-6 DNA methylase [Oscillospiraceae bacterium]|nr:N-6 DNA methylase [Oscillospiraceae bacterium]
MKKLSAPLESATRIKINDWLINLGWTIDENSPFCNCFTERARMIEENKKLSGGKPDYVLYESKNKKPIAIIEAKRPGGCMKAALTQAIEKYAKPLKVNIVFVTDGIFVQAYHVADDDYLYFNSELVSELLSEEKTLDFAENGSKLFSEKSIVHTKVELIKKFADANIILRKDGLSEGKERFGEFANLLFLKLMNDIESYRVCNGEKRSLDAIYCWDNFKNKPADELYAYINGIVLRKFGTEYNQSEEIFNIKLAINKPENLKDIVDSISTLGNLLDTNSDVKGDAFEYFLKNSISVGTDLGEYFTPRHIVKIMTELLDLKFKEKIYDPCCGTGGFLIEAFKNIKSKCKLTEENLKILKNETVFGRELTNTAKIAKMNMIIMGDGHNNIEQKDCLEFPVDSAYDVVLSNFAFSQITDYGSYYNLDTIDANLVFLKHIFDSLNDTGRCAVVVPEGLLFDTKKEYIKIRKILVEQSKVVAVIRLHSFVFRPYTGQPTSIVVFEKGLQTDDVWFFDVAEDGFLKTGSKKGRKKIAQDDLIFLRQHWKEKSTTEKSFLVSKGKIAGNEYVLSFGAYRKKETPRDTITLKQLMDGGKIIIGFTPPRDDDANWFGGHHLWAKGSDITDEMYISHTSEMITDIAQKPGKLLPADTLLFSFKLSIGKVAITKVPLYTNEGIAGLIIKDEIIRKYLYYVLPTVDFFPNRAAKGNTLNSKSIPNIRVPFIDYMHAKDMVEQLDVLESKKQRKIQGVYEDRKKQLEIIRSIGYANKRGAIHE